MIWISYIHNDINASIVVIDYNLYVMYFWYLSVFTEIYITVIMCIAFASEL